MKVSKADAGTSPTSLGDGFASLLLIILVRLAQTHGTNGDRSGLIHPLIPLSLSTHLTVKLI